ncbi:CoA transferase [Phenylobacterium montanum]|uniref:CoA transferase n=1 Tax=Phenylobacterium montanum TaxID=2823693 RepID=A0A975IYF2_9CAUL|nr:CoA transferase [Caulobacter sp. S6]QUD90391.1 CoA transferase [Caulobacter sp. S6]
MSAAAPAHQALAAEIASLTARLGRRVEVASLGVTDRADELALGPAGDLVSPNRACRLVRARDGWVAVNLAREEDRELIPAWLAIELGDLERHGIEALTLERCAADLAAGAADLGLPVAIVGEVTAQTIEAQRLRMAPPGAPRQTSLKVVDASSLWAGPLCGAVLAAAGAEVTKIESQSRPDPTPMSTPGLDRRLNGGKRRVALDFRDADHRERLRSQVRAADVLITSARPRALIGLGLDPAVIFADNPRLVWVAVTGYGWADPPPGRVAFGDDAAAAGGLVAWTQEGEPRFLGDALADPLTGLAAVVGALKGLAEGGGILVDAALARCAAGAAALLPPTRAA